MHTVLNVDDTAANRYIKSRALRQAGFHVVEAGTAEAALALVHERRPDLILLDIKLPDMSGLDMCRLLKGDPRTHDIPVVHISATFVDEMTKASSMNVGAEVYLAEPVGPQELTSTLKTVLRLRAAERAMAENHERMRLATEGAGIATWDIGVGSSRGVWSPQFYAMLGYKPDSMPPTVDTWLSRVRPDEREAAARAFAKAMQRNGSISLEHWIERADNGEARCIAAFGSMELDDEGRAARLIGVAMEITERKRAEAERERLLEQARAAQRAAEEASRMKDEFLAVLSHELRTPMTAVLGWLHVARSGKLTPEQHEKALETVERNARIQTQLIEDLLDVSRIVTGKLQREDEAVPIDRVVESAIETARLAAGARRIELTSNIEPGKWVVQGSPARLGQIFNNLLSNAVKFSPEGGRIDVRVERGDGHVRATVTDQGEGLAPELLARVFDSFRQADSSTRRRHGGLGLGLAIVKSLVELHGGTVAVESAGVGRGASFIVTLPLLLNEGKPRPKASKPSAAVESLRGLHVLAVDDEPDHLELTAHMLRIEGATVVTAGNAADALVAARASPPDVLVLDIAMPETDGYELLQLLRRETGATDASLPAVALTGFASASDARRAEAAGFQAHVSKPFDIEGLRAAIMRIARKRSRKTPTR